MEKLIKSNKFKLAFGAFLLVAVMAVCAFFASANLAVADDEAVSSDNDARTVKFHVYDPAGGNITPAEVTIPGDVTDDEYTIDWKTDSNNETKQLVLTCDSFSKDLDVEFYDEGHCKDICFYSWMDVQYFPGETFSFEDLTGIEPGINDLWLAFYGDNMYVASVTGTPENRHDHFELTVDIPPELQFLMGWPPVMNVADLMKALDIEWIWGDEPEYIVEYMFSDGSILKDRPYVIDADGTLHVQIGVMSIDTKINAKAIGKDGSTFKNWILNGEVKPNNSSGIIEDAVEVMPGLLGYDLVAEYYDVDMCTVTFDSQGGSSVTPAVVEKGQTVTKPSDPTKDGCVFDGWYTTPECTGTQFDFATTIETNMTLYAKWVELPKIIDGEGAVWYFGSLDDLSFTTTAKYEDIVAVTVDDGQVDTSAYTVESKDGNTVVSLKSEYLTLMKDGEHHIGIVSNVVLSAGTELYVTYASFTTTVYVPVPTPDPSNPTAGPQTGDYILWITVLSALCGVLIYGASRVRSRRTK